MITKQISRKCLKVVTQCLIYKLVCKFAEVYNYERIQTRSDFSVQICRDGNRIGWALQSVFEPIPSIQSSRSL